jgi:flagellar protein FlaF
MLNGYSAYTNVQNKTDDPRDIEYRLLAQVTRSLMQARDNPKEFNKLVEAILWNRDVWAALRIDLADPGNQLPKELRASLISISIWIEKETYAIMDHRGDIDAVININRNIMAGLRPEASEQEPGIS